MVVIVARTGPAGRDQDELGRRVALDLDVNAAVLGLDVVLCVGHFASDGRVGRSAYTAMVGRVPEAAARPPGNLAPARSVGAA